MAVVYAVKNGNWSDTSTWNTGALPQPGDTVCANNYTVTIDQDVDLWVSGSPAGIITTRAYSPAVAGGGFTCARDNTVIKCKTIEGYTTTLTITANNATIYSDVVGSNHASTQYLYAITFSGAGTLQIYGNVTGGIGTNYHYGVNNSSSGTISITGNVTGGSSGSAVGVNNNSSGTISITGNVTGGSSGIAFGVNNASSGTISITGNVTGGSSGNAFGVNNNSSGTINITGNVTGGSSSNAFGVHNNSTGTINITGNVTGGSGSNAYGVNNGSTGIVNVTGTSHYGKAVFAFYSTANGTLRVVGDLYADPSPAVYWTGSSAYCAIDGNEYGGISGAAQGSMAACVYKRAQPQAKNRFIRVAEADSSLSGYSGQAGYFYGALYGGTLGLPSEDDVRAGVAYGPSSELTGTCAVPPPQSVAYGVPVDDTTGTAALTPELVAAAVWDALRSNHTETGTFGAVSEWAGGGSEGSDWTDTEKQQIRYRLGIDGTTEPPSTNTPHLGNSYSTLDDLATHVSTRLAASDYEAPDNASISAIKTQTDKFSFAGTGPYDVKATLDGEKVTVLANEDKTGYSLATADVSAIADAVWDEATSGHQTAGTYGKTSEWTTTASGVWGHTTRTLTAFGFNVTVDMSQTLPTSPGPGTVGEALKRADTLRFTGAAGEELVLASATVDVDEQAIADAIVAEIQDQNLVQVVVQPLVANVQRTDGDGGTITGWTYAKLVASWTISDADLSGHDLRLIVFDRLNPDTAIAEYGTVAGEITITYNAPDSLVQINGPDTKTPPAGTYGYVLRDQTTDVVLLSGRCVIQAAPDAG